MWKNLALPILRCYRLEGHLSGDEPCPPKILLPPNETASLGAESSQTTTTGVDASGASSTPVVTTIVNLLYELWVVVDQLLLDRLYNSMTPVVATQVMRYDNARDLWAAIQELFGV